MSKGLKIELFDIYDVVVFEDENGITQDCVCSIGKDKEVENEIDVIVCNNNIISIYYNGGYKVWERDGKDLPYYSTNKKIIHLYTLKNDNRFYDIYPIDDYVVTVNAKSSEALEIVNSHLAFLEKEKYNTTWLRQDFTTIKQYILKSQEQEKVLEIIFEKNVNIGLFVLCDSVREYNKNYKGVRSLTQDEFDLLKRYCDDL